jgi:hypothetical protein
MRKFIALLFLFVFAIPTVTQAQDEDTEENAGPPYMMVELSYMLPKVEMESDFVEAVKKHNEKWHSKAPYTSSLWYIRSGEDAGWFVWTMGPMIFSDLDNAPGAGDHQDAWAKSVAPTIAKYGHVENWVYKEDWSHSDGEANEREIVWFMDVEESEKDRFGAFMEKVGSLHQAEEKEIHSWTGSFASSGRDYALVIPFDSYTWFDMDDWDIEEAFDEMYGEDAWELGMEMMDDIVLNQTNAIWERVK